MGVEAFTNTLPYPQPRLPLISTKRAAELRGPPMSDFVVSAVQDATQRAIEQAEIIRQSLADQESFKQALL